MKTSCSKFLTITGAILLSGGVAYGQMNQPGPPQQQRTMQENQMGQENNNNMGGAMDAIFVKEALQGGMAEVQLGQLAAQKGQSDDVKQFGQKMVDDHTKLDDQMIPIAQQIGVKVPSGPSMKDKHEYDKLNAMSGKDFDDAYIRYMVKDHKTDNKDFMQEAQNGQNPAVKQAAQQGDQVIQQHLQMIEQIAKDHHLMAGKHTS